MNLEIPYLSNIDASAPMDTLSAQLDVLQQHVIGHAPWAENEKIPKVSFAIAYNEEAIFLKYYVQEKSIKAVYNNFNDPVYEDSCVEFFLAFNGEAEYYNLEFNCVGNSRVQFGAGKNGRTFIPDDLLKGIRYQSQIKTSNNSLINWELSLYLPKQLFKFHSDLAFDKNTARVNFYKCGDGLPDPHFLCWASIEHVKPEFHLPRFFKDAIFKPEGTPEML